MPAARSETTVVAVNPYAPLARECAPSTFAAWCAGALGVSPAAVRRQLEGWLEEDHGGGCVSLWAGDAGAAQRQGVAVIVAKEDFVLCGLPLMAEVFRLASDGAVRVFADAEDGTRVRKGDVVLAAYGAASALLLAERVALNLASRLSGVSTLTARYVALLAQASVQAGVASPTLLETRKTTPGLRVLEKYATRTGGARNHRHGLDGGAMLKENHLRAAGDIVVALRALKQNAPVLTKIEIEVTNLVEFEVALAEGADVIMLDNFSAADVREAAARRARQAPGVRLEVSGNLDGRDPGELVSFGVDFVSMGALIHKAIWVDMSLQFYAGATPPEATPAGVSLPNSSCSPTERIR